MNQKNFHCAHIISRADGGTDKIDNLLPICARCNLSMGKENLLIWAKSGGYEIQKFSIRKHGELLFKYDSDIISLIDNQINHNDRQRLAVYNDISCRALGPDITNCLQQLYKGEIPDKKYYRGFKAEDISDESLVVELNVVDTQDNTCWPICCNIH
jgi:hypothetical protein